MSTLTETKPWDLSHVLEFTNSLSTRQQTTDTAGAAANAASHHANGVSTADFADEDDGGVGLGSFGKVWEFLGTSGPTKDDVLPPLRGGLLEKPTIASKLDYTSDGAAYTLHRGQPATPRRHPSFTDGTDGEYPRPDAEQALTKTQKKRMQRRRKRDREAAEAQAIGGRADAISESEAEIAGRRTPASKASAHTMKEKVAEAPREYDRTEVLKRIAARKCGKSAEAQHMNSELAALFTPSDTDLSRQKSTETHEARLDAWKANRQSLHPSKTKPSSSQTVGRDSAGSGGEETTSQAVNAVAAAMSAIKMGGTPPTPSPIASGQFTKNAPSTPTQSKRQPIAQTQPVQRTQLQTPQAVNKIQLVPSSVGVQPIASRTRSKTSGINPTAVAQRMHVPAVPQGMQVANFPLSAKKPHAQPVIEPRIIRSGEDRHWALLMKLINVFGDDRKHLVSPMNMTTHNNDPRGIHVFVDASNIFIGFMDMLKKTRGIHPMARVPDAHLSFDGLALLMERRRPVAKRVLAGSYPWIPEFDKAKAVGYEMNIFEKVYKARELTERQLFFQEQDALRYGKKSSKKPPPVHPNNQTGTQNSPPKLYSALKGIGSGSGSGGTETSTQPQYAPPKMIEQGVDEILHLKMLESVVDYEIPSTIVLGTGDAAAAEYSEGFMAMVERALKKGWAVELLSWSQNINKTYIKSQWTEAWDGRFKIIYLDDFAEELLDM